MCISRSSVVENQNAAYASCMKTRALLSTFLFLMYVHQPSLL